MNNDRDRSPEQIQNEVRRTRDQLDATLSAIERRLAPGQLMEDGLHYLRNNGATEYVANLGDTAKRDPIPLALVGVGLAWLVVSARRDSGSASEERSAVGAVASSAFDGVSSSVGGAISGVKDAASNVKDVASSVRDKVTQTTQAIAGTAQSARDRASQIADVAREGADRVRGSYNLLVNEQPLAFGAIGLAIGALLAAGAPRTRTEDNLLGEASDDLKGGLAAVGREKLEKVKKAGGTAEEAARKSLVAQPPAQDTPPPDVPRLPPPADLHSAAPPGL